MTIEKYLYLMSCSLGNMYLLFICPLKVSIIYLKEIERQRIMFDVLTPGSVQGARYG
jgi:hypothetical protein